MFSIVNMDTNEKIKSRMKDLGVSVADIISYTGATKGSVSQWLSGTSKPGNKYLPALSELLECSPKWLIDNKAPFFQHLLKGMDIGDKMVRETVSSIYNPYPAKKIELIPMISWVNAGSWDEPIDNHHVGDAEEWLPCPLECSPEATFALRVTGESMDSGAADGYRDGEIIFVDGSQLEPKHNADVIVKNGGGKVTFKRLINSNGTWYLKPLNPNWPDKIIELDEHATLVGRVMFSGKAR